LLAPVLFVLTARSAAGAALPEERHRALGCETDAACATALYAMASKEDAALDLALAAEDYQLVELNDPSSPFVPQARSRAAELHARYEGGFVPLVKLERVRRDPKLASDAGAIDALVRDADGFPEGLVRIESWSLAADAYAGRLGRPNDALPLYRRIVGDPRSDAVRVRDAAREAAAILFAKGDLEAAGALARLPAVHDADPGLETRVARLVRRHRVHLASVAVLVATAAMAAAAWAAAARARAMARVATAARRIAPIALGYAAYVGGAGALLASGYEGGTARPFLFFGVVLGPILLLARAWAAAGRATRSARALRAFACAASALAAAFLVLEGIDAAYLEGMGL
jgi:hypothetical protein